MNKKTIPLKSGLRRRPGLPQAWFGMVITMLILLLVGPASAQLPQSFTVTVDKGGGEMVELNLTKHSIRSTNCRVVTWDSTNGYVEVHTPSNPAYPSQTYRGYVTENPNHVVLATVHSGNSLQAEAHDGEGRVWSISGVNVATELGNGNSNTPTPAPLSAGSGTTVAPGNPGQYFPPIGLYQAHGVEDVPSRFYDSNGSSVADTLTWLEHQWNVFDYFNVRDAKLSMSLTEIIIRKEQYYFPASGSASAFNSLLRNEWQTQGQNKRGFIHSWFPYNFSYAGGYNTGKNMYAAGGEAIAVNALYHEVGHAWRCEHYYYGKETMTGSHPSHSEPNTQRVLYTRQLEIDQDDGIELLTSYATNVHPRAAADMTTTMVDTAVNISPMDNDYDANGDVISIKSYTTNTAKGGAVTESNGVLTYTPANGYVGKDIIVYEVQDTVGLYAKGLITIEVINGGLAAHWDMEDSSGTHASDLSGNGHDGSLVGADFATATVPGPVGNAVALTASQYMIADGSNLILDPDTNYPLDAVTSNFFDPIDADFSAAAWVKLAPGSSSAVLMSKTNKASFGYRILLNTSSGVTANLRVWDGLTGSTTASGGSIAEDTWYHVAMVINRGDNTLKVYLNGQEVGSASVPANFPIFNGREDLKIGGDIYGDSGGAFVVDDVRIYTKALNVSEVSALHAQGDVPAGEPSPASGSVNLAASSLDLSWVAGQAIYEHDVYFGTDAAAVASATTASPEYQGRQSGATFDPGTLNFSANYFWRIDEVDGSTIIGGPVWSFSTAATVLTENLVLHLTMDAADVQNADGNAHTWDDIAFPAQDFEPFGEVSEGTTGIIGQAVDLSATDDSLRSKMVNPIQRPSSGGVTFSFWINTTSTNSNDELIYSAGGGYLMLYNNGDLTPVFDGSLSGAQSFNTNINDGQWHHIVAQNDGAGTTTVYVDGLVAGTQSESLYDVGSLDRNLAIGSDYDSTSQNVVASFDDFAVWERTLTHGEIFSIYQSGLAGNSFSDVPFLTNTSFEAADGFTGFNAGSSSVFSSITGTDGSVWTSVSDARIWNRTDIPPDGVQTLALGLGGSGDAKVDLSFPGADHGVGTVSFDYASYSSSANATFRLLYNDGSGWEEAWSTQIIGLNPNYANKPWPNAEVAINVTGDVELRFETSGAKGAKFDNVKITGIAGIQPNSDPAFLTADISVTDGSPGFAYSGSIAAEAVDANVGDTLTFTKLSGASWLSIGSDGTLSGNPASGDLGDNVFTVQVSDGNGGTATATLTITIGEKVFARYDSTTNDPVIAGDVVDPLTVDGGSWSMFDSSLGSGDIQEGALLTDAITGQSVYAWRNLDGTANNNPGYSINLTSGDMQLMWDNGWQLTTVVRLEQGGHFYSWNTRTTAPGGTYVADRRRGVSLGASGSDVTLTPQGGSTYTVIGALAQSFVKIVLSGDAGEETYAFRVYDLDDTLLHEQTGILPSSNTSDAYVGIQSGSSGGDNREAYINLFELKPTIEESNTPPSATDAVFAVNENAAVSTVVGAVSATDPDVGDTLTYAITAGNAGGEFAINSGTGEITTTTALDYESVAQYVLTVEVTDDGTPQGSDTATVTVDVNNINEAPVASDASGSISENSAAGAVAAVSASDPDSGDSLSYAITAGNGGGFFAVDSNGNVSTTGALDYEASSQYVLTVTVTDSGALTDTATVTIDITDVNEVPIASGSTLAVAENGAPGVAAGSVSAIDPDAGDSLGYAITAGNGSGLFTIDINGNVTTTGALNYEAAVQHALTVTVTDGGGLTDTAVVTINVSNVNEAPVVSGASGSVAEDASDGTLVATVSSVDPDAGDAVSYAITGGNTGSAFAIDSSGNITTAAALDYDTTASYSLTVTATDNGGLTDSAVVTVTVTSVNSDPVFANDPITGSDALITAAYSATLDGTATDADTGDVLTYSKVSGPAWLAVASDGALSGTPVLADAGLNAFVVEVSDGNGGSAQASLNITVQSNGVLFLEDFQSYDVENPSDFSVGGIPTGNWTVSNTGSNATRIFNTGNFGGSRLWISNVDGTSITSAGIPATSHADYSLSSVMLTETSVGSRTLNATYDVLVGQDAASAVSIIGGPQAVVTHGDDWQTANSKVDHTFGQSFQTGSLNAGDQIFVRFERVNVLATGGWFGVDDVQIDLNGVNTAPVASDDVFAIAENSAVSSGVGTVVASDPDAGDSLSYAITAGNTGGVFAIDASGNLSVAGALDYETTSQYVLTVTVSDDGAPSLSDTATITVNVSDVNEAPVVNDNSGNVTENAANGTVVASVLASDVDAGDSLGYSITGGNTGGAFAIDGSGVITTTTGLDFETTSSYSLTVTVTDNGLLTDTATVVVTVNDVNEAPVANDASGSIAENTAAGASVTTVVATDVDAGDTLGYAITSGNTGNAFSIDANGNITTNVALDYETLSSYLLTVTVTDNGSLTDTAAVSVSVTDVVETTAPVIVTGSASNLSQSGADIAYTVSDDGGEAPVVTVYYGETNGGSVPANWSNSSGQGAKANGAYLASLNGLSERTTYYFSVHASNSAGESWGSVGSFTTTADTSPKLVRTTVSAVSNTTWTTVDLGKNYNSAVIVATPIYPDSNTPPVVTRVSNVSGSSFDLKIDRADGLTGSVSVDVSVIAVEEGVYTQATDGVTMEAVKFTSTVTARKSNWNAEARTYQNTYTAPVVVGQVMSANDANWSVFWSMGSSRTNPVDASNLNVGKHVAEDGNTTRADETIGYIVIESGSGTINGVAYEAGLGADLPEGVGETTTGWDYSLSGTLNSASAAVLSQSGVDGNDGGWAVLYGANPFTTTTLTLAIDEDQMANDERNHGNEQVGYIVFE